jgi:hypothetical protein
MHLLVRHGTVAPLVAPDILSTGVIMEGILLYLMPIPTHRVNRASGNVTSQFNLVCRVRAGW